MGIGGYGYILDYTIFTAKINQQFFTIAVLQTEVRIRDPCIFDLKSLDPEPIPQILRIFRSGSVNMDLCSQIHGY